jgi:hypothetical protein
MKRLLILFCLIFPFCLPGQDLFRFLSCSDTTIYFDNNCNSSFQIDKKSFGYDEQYTDSLKWFITIDLNSNGKIDLIYTSIVPENTIPGTPSHELIDWIYEKNAKVYYIPETLPGNPVRLPDGQPIFIKNSLVKGSKTIKHKINYKVVDQMDNFVSCTENILVLDTIKPIVDFTSEAYELYLDTSIFNEGICCYCSGPINSILAKDYVLDVEDNCNDEYLAYFKDVPPVKDTLIRVGQIFVPVNLSVPHYFNKHGFLDFAGGPDGYPDPKPSTLGAFQRQEAQLWHPNLRSSSMEETSCSIPYCLNNLYVSVADHFFNATTKGIRTFSVHYYDGSLNTSSSSINIMDEVSIYPNPFSSNIKIDFHNRNSKPKAFTIKDLNGQTLLKGPLNTLGVFTIQTDGLPSGIYILEVQLDNFSFSEKVVKM